MLVAIASITTEEQGTTNPQTEVWGDFIFVLSPQRNGVAPVFYVDHLIWFQTIHSSAAMGLISDWVTAKSTNFNSRGFAARFHNVPDGRPLEH